jgi:hypothetical protein
MAFDAGAIESRLTIDTSAFDRALDKARADVDKFEHAGHKVKISAVFDSGSVGRARKMFADLDNSVSRDAMNRLKSSPQGSVLGSLNALFSPHPVTGAPSPAQSATGGLLGKMLSPQAGGGGSGGGGYSSANGSPLASVLAQTANTTDNVRTNLTGAQPGNVTTTDNIRQALIGQGARNTTTTDDIKQALIGTGATNVTTTDTIKQALTGAGAKNTSTTDTVRERVDPASEAAAEKESGDSGGRSGTSFLGMFTSRIKNLLPKSASDKLAADARKAGGGGGAALGSGLLGGIGPGILGVGAKMAGIVGGVGALLGALPALAGVGGVGIGVALIGGITAKLAGGAPAVQSSLNTLLGPVSAKTGKRSGGILAASMQAAFLPAGPAIAAVLNQVPGLMKSILPALTGVFKTIAPQIQGIFNGIVPVIKGLVGVMQAAAPAFGPFIGAITGLVASILPGLQMIIRSTVPFIKEFAGLLGSLGGNLGSLFATAAPAIGASMKILGGLLGLIGDLLPIVMRLADIFAVTLAPVFTAFAGVVQTLLKPLTIIGGVIAQFAGAVIGDLAGAFVAVASLITAIGPSLGVLAAAFGSLFTVLENAGVFALFGDALENLAPALGKLIALLITDLAPILPMIVGLFSQLLTITVTLATSGLGVLIRVLTDLVSALPVGLVQALVGGFIGLKLVMLGFEGVSAIFGAIAAAVTAMGAALDFDTIALKAMYLWDGLIAVATKAWAAVQFVLDAALNANPIGLLVIALAALGAAIYELVTHWTTVWGTIKSVAATVGDFLDNLFHNHIVQDILDIETLGLLPLYQHWTAIWGGIQAAAQAAWNFIWNGFGKFLLPLLGPVGLIALGVIELYQHWSTIWGDVKTVARDIWTWLSGVFGTDLMGFFTKTIPGWLDELVADAKRFATNAENAVRAVWTWLSGVFGPDIANFFTVTIPGWFDRLIGLTGSHFVAPFQNAIRGAWDWVENNVFDKMRQFFTTTLPGWFDTAVGAIGRFWGGLEKTVSTPVRWVLSNVVDPLFGAIDDVTNFVGLGRPLPANLATGGRLAGYGGGDIVPALLEPGEAVVDKDRTRKYAGLLKMMGVPGFAEGGKILAFGASTTAGYNAPSGYSYVDQLGGMLGGGFSLVNAGIAGNQLTSSGGTGKAGDKRFASLLKGVKAALAWEGVNDLAAGVSAGGVEAGLASLIKAAHGSGIPIVLGTLQPANFTGAKEKSRQNVNSWIRGGHGADAYADLDAILRSGPGSNRMASWAYAGATGANKGIHPGAAGYDGVARVFDRALAQVIGGFKPAGWRTNLSQFSGGGLVGSLFQAMGAPGFSGGGPVGGRGGALGAQNPTGGSPLGGLVSGTVDVLKIITDLALGNTGAAGRAFASLTGSGAGGALGQLATTLTDIPGKMIGDVVTKLMGSVSTGSQGGAGGKYGVLGGSLGANQALGQRMAAARGWVGPLWNDLNAVEMMEAGWNPNAQNPTSNAYGIAQFINGPSEYALYGGNAGSVVGQITGFLNYVAQRYGNPAAALLHEEAFHWYGAGGPILEPVVGYGMNSGRGYVFGENGPEYVTPGGKPGGGGSDPAMLARLDQLIAATRQIPAGVGNSVGGAIGSASHAASLRSRFPRGGA